jgi:hypothetical protein
MVQNFLDDIISKLNSLKKGVVMSSKCDQLHIMIPNSGMCKFETWLARRQLYL